MRGSPIRALPLLAVGCAAAVLLLQSTHRWGLGVSYDSVVYVQASHSLSKIGLPQGSDLGGKPLYWWAPAYPVALRAFGGSYGGARWLNALLLLLSTISIGVLVTVWLDRRSGVVAAVLYAFSPAVLTMHLNLLAEPLFLLLEVATLAALAARRPAVAGACAGLATLTRYAGIPLILVGGIALKGRGRLRFLAVSIAVYAAWMVRNLVVAGQTTGRTIAWHPPDLAAARTGLTTILHLLVTPGSLPSLTSGRTVGLVIELAVGASLLVALLRSRRQRRPPIVSLALLLAVAYLAFLVVTNSLFDALTPYDSRLLVPIVPSIAITLAWFLRTSAVGTAVVCCAFVLASLQLAHTFDNYGMDYSGEVWSHARMGRTTLPTGQLYSTWPAAVAFFTGASPRRLPNDSDEHTGKRNPRFRNQLVDLERRVRTGRASVILLDERVLQIPSGGPPARTFPALRGLCHAIGRYVFVCTTRRARLTS